MLVRNTSHSTEKQSVANFTKSSSPRLPLCRAMARIMLLVWRDTALPRSWRSSSSFWDPS